MSKDIKWSTLDATDFINILDYLEKKWNSKVCINFIEIMDACIMQIQINPMQFPFLNKELQIRKCVITKHNSVYYKESTDRIEILRIYDTRQNPETLEFL